MPDSALLKLAEKQLVWQTPTELSLQWRAGRAHAMHWKLGLMEWRSTPPMGISSISS